MGDRKLTTRLLAFCGATEWGGAEVVLGHLLNALHDDIDISLVGVDATVLERVAARRPGIRCALVPQVHSKRDVRAMRAQRHQIVKLKPEIAQINLPVPFAEPYTVLAALTVPGIHVITVHHLPMVTPWPGIARLMRLSASRLSAQVAVGPRTAREIEHLGGLRAGAVRVVRNGVPAPDAPPRAGSPTRGSFVVGAVGRLHRQKGFDVLIRAIAQIPEAHLVLVGDGPERETLEQLVTTLQIADRVTMVGWAESPTAYLLTFDILAMPSRFEGLPLVLLEAMLHGLPVVATGVGSISDVVTSEETALLVPVEDVAALRVAIVRLGRDDQLRERLAIAASRVARRDFTAEAMARGYERLYAELLGQ